MREAVALRQTRIGAEHLLLGLLRAGDRGAGAVLVGLGVDRARAQELVAALPEESGSPLATWQRLRSFRRRHGRS